MMAADHTDITALLRCLGYTEASGWVRADHFDEVSAHRFALKQASSEVGLLGAFCLMRTLEAGVSISTPLVYVAVAADLEEAREVHRRVWSQGLVPFLIVACPGEIVLCPGFSFGRTDWENLVYRFAWSVLDKLPESPGIPGSLLGPAAELWDLRAVRLRTALFWRDHSIDVGGRVDRRLLSSLEALSERLITGVGEEGPISPGAANGLIGRFLYVYFLFDRGIIDQEWVNARGHLIDLSVKFSAWTPKATWALFKDLDTIFNGSIFPLSDVERAEIQAEHINLVRRVMKHGSEPLPSGGEQLSFLDFYLGTLRTETLSSVYEQFLENLRAGERRVSGAFYTPPFLVDFILDRTEEQMPLADGVTVLDPAAGSGVFLVGAYRRMIERFRWTNRVDDVSLERLRGILKRNIFGIERNRDACHVAAFSLYLTMLDYVSPRDLTRVAAGQEAETLFPALVGTNIQARDFFAITLPTTDFPERVDCIVGNPPWQSVSKLESAPAVEWRDAHRDDAPIGNDQAAELFAWKALDHHLKPNGLLGFLLPAKSFINPTSETFRLSLARRHTILGAANFAHLRYRLFASARQAVVAAFVRGSEPTSRDLVWVYSPLSVGQPLARKEWPWTILLDRSEVQTVRHDTVAKNRRGWFEMFMLRPVDRYIRKYLEDGAITGRFATLEELCATIGARISRGGNSEETGLAGEFLHNAPNTSDQIGAPLFDGSENSSKSSLPHEQMELVRPAYKNRFGGNVLLIPRNLKNVTVVARPFGFSSSIVAMSYDKPAEQVTPQELALLKAVNRFLCSDMGLYLVATTGRRWLMDRRNIEPDDLKALYVPITGLNDARVEQILAAESPRLPDILFDLYGLEGDMREAIKEFLAFRIGFRDGEVPLDALSDPHVGHLASYRTTMSDALCGLIGRNSSFEVEIVQDRTLGLAAISVRYLSARNPTIPEPDLISVGKLAIDEYSKSSANSFTDGLSIEYRNPGVITSVKPLEYYRWTLESAFSDSQQIMKAFSEGGNE